MPATIGVKGADAWELHAPAKLTPIDKITPFHADLFIIAPVEPRY
jgi:hypothetical protein